MGGLLYENNGAPYNKVSRYIVANDEIFCEGDESPVYSIRGSKLIRHRDPGWSWVSYRDDNNLPYTRITQDFSDLRLCNGGVQLIYPVRIGNHRFLEHMQ